MRFVAFGDIDGNDGASFRMLPDVKVAVIKDDDVRSWWASVTGIEDNISSTDYVPPGAQVQSSVYGISAAPVSFVTTDQGGVAEKVIRLTSSSPIDDYMFCVVSPVDESLIAGCSEIQTVWHPSFEALDTTFYIYFSDGRVYIDRSGRRYQLFQDGTWASADGSDATSTIAFVSILYSDVGPPTFLRNRLVAVIKDEDIGHWWGTISGDAFSDKSEVLLLNYYEGIQFDPRLLGNTPARIVNTGYDAIAKIETGPGDYLFCEVTYGLIGGCIYEHIAASQVYIYEINPSGEGGFYIGSQSEGYIERHLRVSKDWEFSG